MSNPQRVTCEMTIQDPTTGEWHTFTGATEEEADAAADAFFGVDEADQEYGK